ncbi:MAG: hypothetical protein ACTS3F_03740 [Phycisphaerales bacterium]
MKWKPNRTKIFWYFTLPAAVSAALLAMYFSGVPLLENIIAAPHVTSVPWHDVPVGWHSRRELGLVENLQHLFILAVVILAARAAFTHSSRFVRATMALVALAALLLLLEELDYGLHYYDIITGRPGEEQPAVRNLHNQGDFNTILKSGSNAAMILVFGIAPFALAKVRNKWVRYFTPDPYMALLLIVALLVRTVAHTLHRRDMGYGFDGMSEFREVIVYYTGLVYTWYLVRRTPGDDAPAPDRPDSPRPPADEGLANNEKPQSPPPPPVV